MHLPLLHISYTLFSHICNTFITLVTPALRICYTFVTPLLNICHIPCYTFVTPLLRICNTRFTLLLHPLLRLRYTVVTLTITILIHSYSVAFCPVFVLWHFVRDSLFWIKIHTHNPKRAVLYWIRIWQRKISKFHVSVAWQRFLYYSTVSFVQKLLLIIIRCLEDDNDYTIHKFSLYIMVLILIGCAVLPDNLFELRVKLRMFWRLIRLVFRIRVNVRCCV